jgi:hypothetical protein
MQKTQQIIVLIGIALAVAMALFPPWSFVDENKVSQPMGYAPIWKPPVNRHQDSAEIFGIKLNLDLQTQKANSIDLGRLAIQILLVAAVTAGAVVLLKPSSAR